MRAWQRSAALGSIVEARNAHHRLGAYFEKARQPDRARAHTARAFLGAAQMEFAAGNFGEARKVLRKVVEDDPRLEPGWYYLGAACLGLGDPEGARKAFTKCLELDPGFGRAHTGLELLDGN